MGALEDLNDLRAIRPPKTMKEAAERLWTIEEAIAKMGPFKLGDPRAQWCVNLSSIWYFIDKTAKEGEPI